MNNNRSNEIFERLKTYIPGGVNSPVRAFNSVDSNPIVMKSGHGSIIEDVDGNQYIDFVGSWGPLILGHSHHQIVQAVKSQIDLGTHLSGSTDLEVTWAEWVRQLIPSAKKVRFHSSGTEADMMAIRMARAYTGKSKVIKFQNHFGSV